jgi:signal transduction histidine kinase
MDRLKTEFLNMVSHELRTPLTAIMGFTEFLEDGIGGTLTTEHEDYVHQIQHGTAKLCRLVDDLLDFARDEAGSLKLVRTHTDLGRTVDEALEILEPLLRDKGLALGTHFPDQPAWVDADAGRVGQVLFNLVGNAVKFTPRGGHISVTLTESPDDLKIEVTDTGAGIAPEHLPQLFERFYQVDSSTTREEGGVGLGLSIANAIVKAHGGTIGVTSTLGAGSTFWFTLPRQPELRAAKR